jgi:hypothetical protein
MVAWPDEYGKSGVMTLVVNHYGDVYQKDLGPKSAALASAMTEYNRTTPGRRWRIDAAGGTVFSLQA